LNAEKKGENLIGETFRNIIVSYNEDSTYDVEKYTKHLIYLLRQYFFYKTRNSGQQDSQDFLTELLSILTNTYYERLKVTKPVVEEAPVPQTVREAIEENESTETHSFIQDLFQFTVIRTATCQKCMTKSFKAEYQEIFTLEFGSGSLPSVRFRDLFNTSFREKDLGKSCESKQCVLVSHILSAVRAKKNKHEYDEEYRRYEEELRELGKLRYDDQILHKQQMKILKPAKNLIISFKRFEKTADGISSRKINKSVSDIPFRMNLKDYIYGNNKDIIYDLYAFIHHSGGLSSGHYINYVKIKNQWWFVDDTKKARSVDNDTDVKLFYTHLAQSYILFYTKIE
jgi:ubiquitin C-terminal hydrolase